jgi:ATP/maltotriose-dependent transcriptional regulator MalT
MLNGDKERIRAWVDGCGLNDLDGFPLRDSYALLTLAKGYIALGELRNAATLLEGLTLAMQTQQRTLDTIECLANSAIVCERMSNTERASAKLEQALLLGQEYGYIRVFADLGKPLFHLITRYLREERPNGRLDESYLRKVTEAASIFSTLHPALYAAPSSSSGGDNGDGEGNELTPSEILVLQLLEEGKSNRDIAAALHIQQTTVKFHLQNIFEKMSAANRTEAVKKAREKKLLV